MLHRIGPLVATLGILASGAFAQIAAPPPSPVPGLADAAPVLMGDDDPAVKPPRELLGFEVGDRAATHAEIERCFKEWDASPRAALFQYATTHEGRALYYMVITSPANMDRLDAIKSDLASIADPRDNNKGDDLARSTPAVAWLAYSIHGDETSGADAAIAVAYHLIASRDEEVRTMLDDLVVIIDPMMNPDGRDRFLKMVREHRGNAPNVDDQALLHTGYWPMGRTNHYLFDLNRDWIFCVHPETRGRVRAVGEWNPVMFVDAHEMGAQDTFLFSPSREPVNNNLPERRKYWWDVFARDQARAFDANGWRYYTGEWNEEWYPGYSSSWAGYRGAVGILYEQAGVAQDGVLQANDSVLTYKRAVRQQATSSIANLRTLQTHRQEMMLEFAAERRRAVADKGTPFAGRAWAIMPDGNRSRTERFLDLMRLQGFEVRSAARSFRAAGKDELGRTIDDAEFPQGTLIVVNAQPQAALLASMMEFDQRMKDDFLTDERREILRFDRSKLYDVTAWNIPMMFDLHAYELSGGFPAGADLYRPTADKPAPARRADVAWIIDGSDDDSVSLAARLMERGVEVRVAAKPFKWGDDAFPRGSVLVTIDDNRRFDGDLLAAVNTACAELSLTAASVDTGLGEGDIPDLGGENFTLLERPRIALLSRDSLNLYDVGSTWHELDFRMGVGISMIDADAASYADLRRYNVLIIPGSYGDSPIAKMGDALKQWVEAGGTLIAIDDSAGAAAHADTGIGSVRTLPDVLEDLAPYELALAREWEARNAFIVPESVWSTTPPEVSYPWDYGDELPALPEADELKRRDEWQRSFMPQGALLAARVDDRHWLTMGCRDTLPVLMGPNPVLMSAPPAEAPIRLGVYEPQLAKSDSGVQPPARVGWGLVPPGYTLRLRMAGLLWPEAAQRLANAAWVTRESVGRGQVILFASCPTFRGATPGMARVLRNAVVYGPGFGASHPITP